MQLDLIGARQIADVCWRGAPDRGGMTRVLHFQLFGDFQLACDGATVNGLSPARLQSLLAYLALHHTTPQPRRYLAFLLWPDSIEAQARTNLRHLLHQLRKTWPEADHFLGADAQTVRWQPNSACVLDVADFEWAIGAGLFREAVALYTGDLLPQCYDDWIFPERERLRQMFIGALEQLARRCEHEGDHRSAIGYAQRLLQLEPLREETHRRLIRLHALNGDRAAALRAYHMCATLLRRELSVEPGTATRDLYAHLLNIETSPTAITPEAALPAGRPAGAGYPALPDWQAAEAARHTYVHPEALAFYQKASS